MGPLCANLLTDRVIQPRPYVNSLSFLKYLSRTSLGLQGSSGSLRKPPGRETVCALRSSSAWSSSLLFPLRTEDSVIALARAADSPARRSSSRRVGESLLDIFASRNVAGTWDKYRRRRERLRDR